MATIPKKGKRFILAKHFQGLPKHSNFQLKEFDIPELKNGGKYNFKL